MEKQGSMKQGRVLSATVGSYPKPDYLYSNGGRDLLDNMGMTLYDLREAIGEEEFRGRLDKAAAEAIEDQNLAGIDYITDGEERRGHYVLYILRGLHGIDFNNLREMLIRGGAYKRNVPVVSAKIEHKKPFLVGDWQFTQKRAKTTAKIGLPGPSTVTF